MGPQETDCSDSGLCNDTQHGGEKPLFLKDLFLLQEMPFVFRGSIRHVTLRNGLCGLWALQ